MLIETRNQFVVALSTLAKHDELTVDTETTGLDHKDRVCGVSVLAGDSSYYFPFRHEHGPNLPIKNLYTLCVELEKHKLVGFNFPFDIRMLAKDGFAWPTHFEDSQLTAHLMNENEESFKLEELGAKYITDSAGAEEDALLDTLVETFGGSRKKAKGNLWRLASGVVAPYAEQDVRTTRALRDFYLPHLREWDLEGLWHEVCDYSSAIARMTHRGLLLDVDLIHKYIGEAERHVEKWRTKIQESAGYAANPNSAPQMQTWLKVKSTAADILERMEEKGDERATMLRTYRLWAKVVGTYYRPFLKKMDDQHVLHPNINPIGTISGRPTCTAPNLFSIPRTTDTAYKVKDVFVARPGYTLLEADISQVEIRVATHYAKETKMAEILKSGADTHGAVAEEFDMPRDIAKRLNLATIYGIGAKTFSKTYNIPFKKSQQYLKRHRSAFPGFRRLYNKAEATADDKGYIRHYTGRIRHFNDHIKAPSYRASSNLVQGAVAEMIRKIIVRLLREMPWCHQLLTVYDSLLFEIPTLRLEEAIPEIKRIMEDQPWCSVPIVVDMKHGPRWGQMEEVK